MNNERDTFPKSMGKLVGLFIIAAGTLVIPWLPSGFICNGLRIPESFCNPMIINTLKCAIIPIFSWLIGGFILYKTQPGRPNRTGNIAHY